MKSLTMYLGIAFLSSMAAGNLFAADEVVAKVEGKEAKVEVIDAKVCENFKSKVENIQKEQFKDFVFKKHFMKQPEYI